MSRRQRVPANIFYRKADPNPPLYPEPWEGDIYYNTLRKVLRVHSDGEWQDINAMRWAGEYAENDPNRWYYPGDVVRDGNWLMICTTRTKDIPAPTEIELPRSMLPDGTFTTATSDLEVVVENEWLFEPLIGGWIVEIGAMIEPSNVGRAHQLYLYMDDAQIFYKSFIPTDADVFRVPLNPVVFEGSARVRMKMVLPADPNNSWYLSEGLFNPPPTGTVTAQGRIGGGAWTDTAYGLHFIFTRGYISPDWTVLANVGSTGRESSSSGAGGGGGDTGILVGFGLDKTLIAEGVSELAVTEDYFPWIDPAPPTDGRIDFWIDTDDIGQGGVEAPAGGGGGHVIQDEGVGLPQRTNLDFQGAGVTVTDALDSTVVTIPGAAGGSGFAPDPSGQPDGKHIEVENGQYVFIDRPVIYSASPPSNPRDGQVWIERT